MFDQVFVNTITITMFVMIMMMIIEFLNVQTRGRWKVVFEKNKWSQVLIAAALGAIPGCLGVYAVVTLYTHGIFTLGALVASMIATFGDEAFVLFGLLPKYALLLIGLTTIIGIISGLFINLLVKNRKVGLINPQMHFHIHDPKITCCETKWNAIARQYRKISFERFMILLGILLFLYGMITGHLGHDHGLESLIGHEGHHHGHEHHHGHDGIDWIKVTFLALASISLVLVAVSSDHFLTEHLWKHIIKKHFFKIFLWTLGAFVLLYLVNNYALPGESDLREIGREYKLLILFIALAIGIIPESGPHIVFIILFSGGYIDFSILLASSIVQDGHGMLPLFAESKKSFIVVKSINLLVGLIVGLSGFIFSW